MPLRPDNTDIVAKIAGLPDLVRGYEAIKLANVARSRRELAAAHDELSRCAREAEDL